MTLCIAVGKGCGKDPHFIFRDIDDKEKFREAMAASGYDGWLIYSTKRGAHFVLGVHRANIDPISFAEAKDLLQWTDPKAPHNAVRIYPNEDYNVLHVPKAWGCKRMAHLYEALLGIAIPVFPQDSQPDLVPRCEPLRFGVYRTEVDKHKAHGEERRVHNKAPGR